VKGHFPGVCRNRSINHEPPLKGVVCSGPIRPRGAGSV